ncbi:hypothetical protein ACOQFO_09650 [Ureibacillus sp. MALMAid1270]|uniref:hypothetical protein n=1 Tax=Ureibacillus sp. MALMAid1270 TaxID=3411629 RepID=UPI003BA472D3
MNKDIEKFKRVYERLCEQLGIESSEEHPFQEVISELEAATKDWDDKLAEERMRRLQRSKQEYFRKVGPNSRSLRERIFTQDSQTHERPFIEKKKKELELKFRQIMRDEPLNAVVRYRYGYFQMEELNYSKAVRYFEEAQRINKKLNCTLPLSEAQQVKVHMYIGFCGGQLLKSSLEELSKSDKNFEMLDTEGRTMEKALLMLMNEREQYFAIVNGEKHTISLTEYLRYKDTLDEKCLLISEVEGPTFLKLGEWQSKTFTPAYSKLTHLILQNANKRGVTTVPDVQTAVEGRYTLSTIERNIRRINEYMHEVRTDYNSLFTVDRTNPEVPKIKLVPENYIYIYREANEFDFTPLNIDEEA